MTEFINKIFANLHKIIVTLLIIYIILPISAPFFFRFGAPTIGKGIHTIYRVFCHQRAERSIFLFGDKLTYSIDELEKHGYEQSILGYGFYGNDELGYKVAFCIRDTFIYLNMSIAGLIALLRKKPYRMRWYILIIFVLPMALDGITQFMAEFLYASKINIDLGIFNIATANTPFYKSNNLKRAITGTLFGWGIGTLIITELKKTVQLDKLD